MCVHRSIGCHCACPGCLRDLWRCIDRDRRLGTHSVWAVVPRASTVSSIQRLRSQCIRPTHAKKRWTDSKQPHTPTHQSTKQSIQAPRPAAPPLFPKRATDRHTTQRQPCRRPTGAAAAAGEGKGKGRPCRCCRRGRCCWPPPSPRRAACGVWGAIFRTRRYWVRFSFFLWSCVCALLVWGGGV